MTRHGFVVAAFVTRYGSQALRAKNLMRFGAGKRKTPDAIFLAHTQKLRRKVCLQKRRAAVPAGG
jgi:hypothetical protein